MIKHLLTWIAIATTVGVCAQIDASEAPGRSISLARYEQPGMLPVRVPSGDAVDWPRFEADGARLFGRAAQDNLPAQARVTLGGCPISLASPASAKPDALAITVYPVLIKPGLPRPMRNLTLRINGKVIYDAVGPLNSLTLLLPQNDAITPYQLSADGKGPAVFSVGVRQDAQHKAQLIPLNTIVAATRPRVTITYAPSLVTTKQP